MARALDMDGSSPGAPGHARRVLAATRRLYEQLGDGGALPASLDILLFLAAEDRGTGVPTSRCCGAVPVPRTTALRWITALAAAGLVDQADDQVDRRVSLLSLTSRSADALGQWLADIGPPPPDLGDPIAADLSRSGRSPEMSPMRRRRPRR